MGNKINSNYKLSSIQNADNLKCSECVICKTLADLNVKTLRSCEQCYAVICEQCHDQREEDDQQECPVCREQSVVLMPSFQRKTYADTPLSCICGDSFTIKDLPRHSNTCLFLKCPICKNVIDTSCREHIQTLADDHKRLLTDHQILQDNYTSLQSYCQQLEQHCGAMQEFIRQNGWETYTE